MAIDDLQALERAPRRRPPTRAMPVEFVRGEGARLWDADGIEYLDFQTGLAVNSLGHCHPAVVAAITRAGRAADPRRQPLLHRARRCGWPQRLSESSLGGKVHFANSGTEAVEAALKVARKARQGGTIVSVAPRLPRPHLRRRCRPRRRRPSRRRSRRSCPASSPSRRPPRRSPPPSTSAPPRCCSSPSRARAASTCSATTCCTPRATACDAHGAALIFDEVQCGLGRTGTLWAYEHVGRRARRAHDGQGPGRRPADRRADLRASAWPTSSSPATTARPSPAAPCSAPAGLAVLDVVEDPALLARVRELGERAARGPGRAARRRRGPRPRPDARRRASTPARRARRSSRRALREQRLVLNATGPTTLRLLPPLTIAEAEADDALARLRRRLLPVAAEAVVAAGTADAIPPRNAPKAEERRDQARPAAHHRGHAEHDGAGGEPAAAGAARGCPGTARGPGSARAPARARAVSINMSIAASRGYS